MIIKVEMKLFSKEEPFQEGRSVNF